jgi:tetratricopeptide (TPR) repeat protein
MKKLIYICAIFSFAFFSCTQKDGSESSGKVKGSKLTISSLYNVDSIKSYLSILTEQDQEDAKKKFLEAIDLIKNKNEVKKSIESFKASALIFPSEKTYFELGSALLADKQYEESRQALEVAQAMGYSPLANVMYKLAGLYSMKRDTTMTSDYIYANDSIALRYMEVALQMGYTKPADFLSDKMFDSLRYNNEWIFRTRYTAAMSGNKDPEKLIWESYKSEFPDVQLPLAVNAVWINSQKYENAIAYDYEKFVPEMRTGKFSREVENEYFYSGKVKEELEYTALMYAGKNMWVTDGSGNSPVYFFLVTYSPTGKIIDKMMVGGQRIFSDNFRTLALQPNLNFEIKDYKNTYQRDPADGGYENNKVVKTDLVSTAYYRITPKGRIEKSEQLAVR